MAQIISIVGLLYDHGHLARAVCCRVGKGDTDVDSLLPPGYRLNHPWLGRVTVCDPPREVQVQKTKLMNHSTTNQQNGLCPKHKDSVLVHADSEVSDQTGWMPRLISVFTGA